MTRLHQLILIAALVLLAGCGKKSADEHYADALNYVANKNYSAAIVELKSAIQQSPENKDFRFELGKLYLIVGDAVSAEKELLQAKRLGTPIEDLALPLSRASFLIENFSDVLQRQADFATVNEDIQAYLAIYYALSDLELGSPEKAVEIFNQLSESANTAVAAFARSNLLISQQEYQQALTELQAISDTEPHYDESLLLKANIQLALQQFADAAETFAVYVARQPRQYMARLQYAQTLVQIKDFKTADEMLAVILKLAPDQAFANYLKSLVELNAQNYVLAKEHADKAIARGYNAVNSRIVAAVSSARLNLNTQALHHLSAIEPQLKHFPELQRLYSFLQLSADNSDKAKQTLAQMDFNEADLALVANVTQALVEQGDSVAARELVAKYQNSVALNPENLSDLGRLQLGIPGEHMAALANLEQALTLDPSLDNTRMLLFSSYIRTRQFDKASNLIESWAVDNDKKNLALNLQAYVHLLQGQVIDAGAKIEQAELQDKDNPFTLLLKASLLAYNKSYEEANQVLFALLAKSPNYFPAIQQAFYVGNQLEKPEQIIKFSTDLLSKNPDNYGIRILLATTQHRLKDYQQVISLLSSVPLTAQLPVQHWVLLIHANHLLGNATEAYRYSEEWYRFNPEIPLAAHTYTETLFRQRKLDEALKVIDLQLTKSPMNKHALGSKIRIQMAKNDFEGALQTLAKLPADVKATAETLYLEALANIRLGRATRGLELLRQSYQLQPHAQVAMLIADTLRKETSSREAVRFIDNHIKQHGSSDTLNMYYANIAAEVDPEQSLQIYKSLLEKAPDNLMLLNNYAWMLVQNDQADLALEYAQRALSLNKQDPNVLDTYGYILVKLNRAPEAIEYFKQTLQLQPNNPEAQLNYAEALIATEQKQQAKEMLDSVNTDEPRLNRRKLALSQRL